MLGNPQQGMLLVLVDLIVAVRGLFFIKPRQ
jgi:hypothetical protein